MQHPLRIRDIRTRLGIALGLTLATALPSHALEEHNVLVVYNSADPDSQAVYNHYLTARPSVIGFDLNDPTVTGSLFTYTDYTSKLRDPIRSFLTTNNLEEQIGVITLTKGIPHRIDDRNNPGAGNNGGTAFTLLDTGNATYASVDAELTLLWQDTETGEANGSFDSPADNIVANPFWRSTINLMDFDRSGITNANSFDLTPGVGYTMQEPGSNNDSDAGDILLTARLDGYTVNDVKAMIDRAQNPVYNTNHYTIILDEDAAGDFDKASFTNINQNAEDYDSLNTLLNFFYPAHDFDQNNADFLIGENTTAYQGSAPTRVVEGQVAALLTYGGNHDLGDPADNENFIPTFEGQLIDGAIYNGLESFSARDFGGITAGFRDQGQLAEWIAIGGTFGTGTVYEPFTFGVADNELMIPRFLLDGVGAFPGMTWVEAAWAGIPYLSWQNVVLGDPLATATLVDVNLGDVPGDLDLNAFLDIRDLELLATLISETSLDPAFDLDTDGDTDADDIAYWVEVLFGSSLGDANLDFTVDLIDLSMLAANFGATDATWSQGDFNADGNVDLIDLSLLASSFGTTAAAPATIPEPAAGLALLLPALASRSARRRN
ncbi:dockerin type I domain-containing protein [Mucisphaera sp.]|uniref:dockerin type I domain-containing protein n=1 Tax=Mucisphaera sp. TaxID=2913024 RepID=UPI003D0EEAEA